MRIATWNVNSVRQRLDHLLRYLREAAPDVLCLQETKVTDDLFPRAALEDEGYDVVAFGQKSYLLAQDQHENVVALIGWQVCSVLSIGLQYNSLIPKPLPIRFSSFRCPTHVSISAPSTRYRATASACRNPSSVSGGSACRSFGSYIIDTLFADWA